MKAALIGLSFSGKSTVFQALTGIESGKKEETVGTIKVPDERIDRLAEIYSPKKKTYSEFVLSDYTVAPAKESAIAPKVKNMIQKSDLLILTVRNFESLMTADKVDPMGEYQRLKEDLILTDFVVVERRLEREQKEKKNPPELKVLQRLRNIFENGEFPKSSVVTPEESELIENYNFLSMKKIIVLVNQPEGVQEIPEDFKKQLEADNISYFCVSAPLEVELSELSPEEQAEFLEDYGLTESAGVRFIKSAYSSLGLISFLTAGNDEVRAWPIKNGTPALLAAGKIHSDIQRGFIRAEVIHFDDFIKYGSEAECKKAAAYRLEGKEYVVRDGDIINFRFNV
ncbi:redox-regulated ATPase YchF [bacterium]|nr:redox-regulated ATPase YchF [bacterium]